MGRDGYPRAMMHLGRIIAGAFVLALLGGCLTVAGRAPVTRVDIVPGELALGAPGGYCVDHSRNQRGQDSVFVLLASCAAISGDPAQPRPVFPAILTATVDLQPISAESFAQIREALPEYFARADIRATLSRDGTAQSIELLTAEQTGDMFILHARDSSQDASPALAEDLWRALYLERGYLVSVTLLALSDRPISDQAARRTLAEFVSATRRANRQGETG